jgi:uncharacterized membrane protein
MATIIIVKGQSPSLILMPRIKKGYTSLKSNYLFRYSSTLLYVLVNSSSSCLGGGGGGGGGGG